MHSVADVQEAVRRARLAQQEFQHVSFETRRQLLRSLSNYIVNHQRDISNVAARDSGKTCTPSDAAALLPRVPCHGCVIVVDAFFGEILTTLEKISWLVQYGEQVLQPEYRPTGALTMHKMARVEYHPLGVVAAIVSWNYPFHNIYGPIVSALFAGNAIIIKPSEYVVWSTMEYYQKIIHACLRAYNLPTELVQFLVGDGSIGSALVTSGVDKVTFIGSPGVGKKTPVVLELGGKDAAIMCEDADLKQAVPIIMRGTYQNVGQNCVGLERIVVHQSIHKTFVDMVVPLVKTLRQGPTLGSCASSVDCGAMTMGRQLEHIQHLVDEAVSKGARVLVGGKISKMEGSTSGQFYEPTILDGVTADMTIAQEEVFGPVMTIMKYGGRGNAEKDDHEAIQLVNSSPYGLGGSVFSNNVSRAERIAAQLRTGMCNINDFGVNYLCQSLPFGGVKVSGFGRFAGVEGLRGECLLRAVTTDRWSFIKTTIPPLLDYPLSEQSGVFCENLAKTVYGGSWQQKAQGAFQLVATLIRGK